MDPRVGAMLAQYGTDLTARWPVAVVSVLVIGAAVWLVRRHAPLPKLLVALALVTGLALAWRQMSIFDDAFISFRYARNLATGHGLVFNPGEYVQGFTNPLWTLGLAAALLVVPDGAPYAALVGNVLSFVVNVVVVFAIGRRVNGGSGFVPLAATLVAVQNTMTAFATSGMETQLASLLGNLALLALVSRRDARGALLAGVAAAASTLTRPDHLIFHGAAGLVVLVRVAPAVWAARRTPGRWLAGWWRAGLDQVVAVSAPGVLFASWLAFSGWYYDSILPNTYYAKSADLWYPSNGAVYSLSFWLASHLWLVVPWLAVWALRPARSSSERDLKVFVLAACVAQQLYVLKVGGDFMFGRFFVATIPLVLLGAEALWHDLVARRVVPAIALLVTMLLTAGGGTLAHHDWWITDESDNYRIATLIPLTIDHPSYRDAIGMRRLGDADLRPTIATCCIGMIGYYVETELIDLRGLTDRRVARMPITERGMPGHEKWASHRYIRRRGVKIARTTLYAEPYEELTKIDWGPDDRAVRWRILAYDRALMDAIRERMPEVRFLDFDAYLDRYVARMRRLPAEQIAADLAFFDAYWFEHNADARRRADIVSALEAARDRDAAPVVAN